MIDLDDRALRGAAVLVKAADRDLRRAVNQATTRAGTPIWRRELATRAGRGKHANQARKVYGPGRVAGGNPPALVAASGSRRLSGGLIPASDWPWLEFGSAGRAARLGQLPRRYRQGQYAYAAAVPTTAVVSRAWVDAIFQAYRGVGETTNG